MREHGDSRRCAASVLLAVATTLVASSGGDARAGTAFGDTVEAARLLADWQYDEARDAIQKLAARAPDSAETRYLLAEMAFVDGRYEQVAAHLQGIDDSVANGSAGVLRQLVASTLSVTREYAHRESPAGHFIIYYPVGRDEILVDLAAEVLDAAYEVIGDDLGYRPKGKVRVEILARPSDLAQLSPLTVAEIETTGTIALCKYGKLMIVSPRATLLGYPWMDTLVHEYTHYVISRTSHNKVPIWLHEGLARFQQARWRRAASAQLSATEEHLLGTALDKKQLIAFDAMHPSMAKLPSQQAAALAFAEVYTMIGFIHERVGYPGIREILAMHRKGIGARRAVAAALDSKWKRLEGEWKGYLRARKLQPQKAVAGRASGRRIRFDKGGEQGAREVENVGLDELSKQEARNHARLGGMLRARGMSEAAAIEYQKALAVVGRSEPFVAGKLSRTYLELSRYEEAIELAEPLLAADENDALPAVTLGLAYQGLGRLAEARSALEAALRVNPFDPAVRCGLAEIYPLLGERGRGERERAACRQLAP